MKTTEQILEYLKHRIECLHDQTQDTYEHDDLNKQIKLLNDIVVRQNELNQLLTFLNQP